MVYGYGMRNWYIHLYPIGVKFKRVSGGQVWKCRAESQCGSRWILAIASQNEGISMIAPYLVQKGLMAHTCSYYCVYDWLVRRFFMFFSSHPINVYTHLTNIWARMKVEKLQGRDSGKTASFIFDHICRYLPTWKVSLRPPWLAQLSSTQFICKYTWNWIMRGSGYEQVGVQLQYFRILHHCFRQQARAFRGVAIF